jgi:hypothetical protein
VPVGVRHEGVLPVKLREVEEWGVPEVEMKKYTCPHCKQTFEFDGYPYLWCPACYGYYDPCNVDIALREYKQERGASAWPPFKGGNMTEDEARKKWCPMARHEGDNGTFNRGGEYDPINSYGRDKGYGCNCVASACMMWVWIKAGEFLSNDEVVRERNTHGHCGLIRL